VLLSFLVAVVVAVSETVLFTIWQSRRSGKPKSKRPRVVSSHHKKNDGDKAVPVGDIDGSELPRSGLPAHRDGQAVRLRQSAANPQED
jgi:hypothetical protein